MTTYSIYRITNLVNDKKYIGWTSRDPFQRYKEHSSGRKPKNQEPSLISLAVEKYGKDNFVFEILYQSIDYTHSREIETVFITENNSLSYTLGGWGYNIDRGGKGHKRSKETVNKWKEQMSGRPKSEEHKKKIAESLKRDTNYMKGKFGNAHPNYGKKLSEQQKKNISEGIKRAREAKKRELNNQ